MILRWAERLAGRLRDASGWRRLALAAGLGLLAAAALPPVYALPLLIPAFAGLVWLLDGAGTKAAAFGVGWAFGAGWFFAGLYWVGIAMTVDLAAFWWFLPIAVGGLSFGLALFTGAATLAARHLLWRGPGRIFALAAAWLLAEWLRSWVLTGFPWNLLGTVWTVSDWAMQPAALGGVWLLSALTLLAAAGFATLADVRPGWRRWAVPAVSLAVLAVAVGGGGLRLALAPPPGEPSVPEVRLRLVQPSIPQDLKWAREMRMRHLQQQAELSMAPGWEEITHVIWAETAVPFLLSDSAPLLTELGQLARPGTVFLTGAPFRASLGGAGEATFNSVVALRQGGAVAARYDKFHLVPFGEYVPFRDLLGMQSVAGRSSDFEAGPGLRTLELPGLPAVGPLICYEVIFSGRVTGETRPEWLLNLTNDAWFGISSGPFQHFATARLRAVEEGLPLVRAANNGVSAVVDPYGRIVASLGLTQVGVVDADLPAALPPTPYADLGRWVLVPLLALLLAGAVFLSRR